MMRKFLTGLAIAASAVVVSLIGTAVYLYNEASATVRAEPVTYSVQHHPGSTFYVVTAVIPFVVAAAIVAAIAAFHSD